MTAHAAPQPRTLPPASFPTDRAAVEADRAILHILQHSLGVDQFGQGKQYRNHFVTGEGSTDYPHCMSAVDAGLMYRRDGSDITGGMDLFHVTDAGRRYVAAASPAPPKLTRSQQRYRCYLDAESSLSFIEWLRAQCRVPATPSDFDDTEIAF